VNNFKNLIVWEKSRQLVHSIYDLSEKLPPTEKYSFASQITRAAVSIPANIAEGCGRATTPDYKRFLGIALGSSYELETFLIIGKDRKWFDESSQQSINLTNEVQKMLQAMIKRL